MTKLVRCGINFYADVDNKKAVNDRDMPCRTLN